LNDWIFTAEKQGAQELPIHFVDLSEEICEPQACPGSRSGIIVYRDKTHLTAKFVHTLTPALYTALTEEIPSLGAVTK
jgi:hypothetical protein